jgi:nitrogen fixation/metabolism regulation signal transduction histidine kinase
VKKNFLVFLIIIQVLALFVLENMRSIFNHVEQNEVARMISASDMQAELYVHKTMRNLPRPEQENYFDQIQPLASGESGKQVRTSGKDKVVSIKKPLGTGTGLLFIKTIRSPQLDTFRSLRNILSGLILFLGMFIVGCCVYLIILLRRKDPEKTIDTGTPFQDYLVEMKNSQLELQSIVAEQNKATFKKEELNKSIINTVHLAVIFTANGKIELFNPSAQKLFNCSFANAKNNSLDTVLHEHPGLIRFIQESEQKNSAEIESGQSIFYADVVPVSDSGRLVLVRDITAEKKREKIHSQNANLMMLGEMAASLAHEVRNSLGVILGYSKTAGAESGNGRKISREIHFLNEMMESFLKFARPVEKIGRKKTDVGQLIATAAIAQEVAVTLPEKGMILESDPLLLQVIFSNLALNAKQAGAKNLLVEFTAADPVTLTIADDGPGIAAANREKIWLPFFSTKDKGTGMGLAIVKKLVSALNGDIQLLNPGEKGAQFKIIFFS